MTDDNETQAQELEAAEMGREIEATLGEILKTYGFTILAFTAMDGEGQSASFVLGTSDLASSTTFEMIGRVDRLRHRLQRVLDAIQDKRSNMMQSLEVDGDNVELH